jgi:hypothetical protein
MIVSCISPSVVSADRCVPFPLAQTQHSHRGISLDFTEDVEELPNGTATASQDVSCRVRSGIVMERMIPRDNVSSLLVFIMFLSTPELHHTSWH